MNLPDEKREQLRAEAAKHRAGGYIVTEDGHRECYCGHVMAPDESYEAHVADALAPLLAGWLAEAWDGALDHVWHLADPAYSVVMTQASKYVVVEADIIQAQLENPYRAALDADAAETTGGGA